MNISLEKIEDLVRRGLLELVNDDRGNQRAVVTARGKEALARHQLLLTDQSDTEE